MKLYRRPESSTWYFDYSDPMTGRRVRKSTERTDKREAQAYAQRIVKEALDRKQFGYATEATIAQVLTDYCENELRGRAYQQTTRSLVWTLDRLFPRFVQQSMHSLSTPEVEAIRTALKGPTAYTDPNRTSAPRERSPQTRNHYIKLLRAAWGYAKRWGVRVDPNVEFRLEPVSTTYRALTDDEVGLLITTMEADMVEARKNLVRWRQIRDARDLTILLLATGARYSEISQLAWGDVSEGCDFVTIRRGKGGLDSTVALPATAAAVLTLMRQERIATTWVFPSFKDPKEPRTMATGYIRRVMNRLGFNTPDKVRRYGRATVHSLRHTFATRLARGGATLYDIQILLGHRSPSTTMRYAKVTISDAALRAKRVLDAIPAHNSDPNTNLDEQRKSVLVGDSVG